MAWVKEVTIRVKRRGPVLDVLELGPGGPGDEVREREDGRVTPRFVVGAI